MSVSRAEVSQWGSEGIIEYLGALDDVRPAFAEAQVYVLSSYREGTPRTVLEVMAMDRPIIITDAPGCRETVGGCIPSLRGGAADVAVHVPLDRRGASPLAMTVGG